MSRIAKQPIILPKGVEAKLDGKNIDVKGPKGQLMHTIHNSVTVKIDAESNIINVNYNESESKANALAGTTRALINNMVKGVNEGFERVLELVGVGYRAQIQGKVVNMSLGFSHPVEYKLPEAVTAEAPNATTIVLKSVNKQLLGQTAAEIRAFRPPEPYKGKGVRYAGEQILRKETKKK